MHANEADPFGMRFFHAILRLIDAQSVLDIGTATGRNLRELKEALPHLTVCGVEPVRALIDQAARLGKLIYGPILQAKGEALPFRDASFDVVCEFAVLHHTPAPRQSSRKCFVSQGRVFSLSIAIDLVKVPAPRDWSN
jgi:SAM-dependent methyltransferase